MSCATPFRWMSAACSHVGLVREINEDACLDQPAQRLWAVADGMGGHTLGDFASRMVIEHLSKIDAPDSLGEFVAVARQQLQAANRQLRTEAAIRDVRIIGSTVVLLLACEYYCTCLWAGDSRLYLYRNGRLQQLSRDHSQLEELKARGDLSLAEPANYPPRNMITRAVGAIDTLDLDEETMRVNDDDMFLLCSDGLSNEVSEQEMCSALLGGNCRQAAEALIQMALRHGGHDNISALVIRAEDPDRTDKTVLNPAL